MRLRQTLCQIFFFKFTILLLSCPGVFGQSLKPIPAIKNQIIKSQPVAKKQPYKMTSRFHLQKGTNKGYLVLRVDLDEGYYIYSLTQPGNIRPTQITTAPSKQFRLTGKFNPDRPATIIEKDPIMNQRIEKHKKSIQFFAPIEVAADVDAEKMTANLAVEGQVCRETGFCIPIMGLKVAGQFAGFFERKAQAQANSQNSQGTGKIRR